MSTRWEGHGELSSLRVRRFRGGWRCTARGEGVLALQAVVLDLDGGGAWSAAHRWRKHGTGAALQRAGGGRAGRRRRHGGVVRERRLSGGVRARSSGGAGAIVREVEERACEADAWGPRKH